MGSFLCQADRMCLVKHHNAEGMRDARPGEDGGGTGRGMFSRDASHSLTVIVGKNHLKPEEQTKHSFFIYSHTLEKALITRQTLFPVLGDMNLLTILQSYVVDVNTTSTF